MGATIERLRVEVDSARTEGVIGAALAIETLLLWRRFQAPGSGAAGDMGKVGIDWVVMFFCAIAAVAVLAIGVWRMRSADDTFRSAPKDPRLVRRQLPHQVVAVSAVWMVIAAAWLWLGR